MKVTFDLNDAQIFLPTGRVMNMKDELGWVKAVEKSQALVSEITNMNVAQFEPHLDTQQALNNEMKRNFMDAGYVQERHQAYKQHVLKRVEEVIEKSTIGELSHSLKNELESMAENVMQSHAIQTKLKKLNQLKEINQANME